MGDDLPAYLVLLRVGFTKPPSLLPARWALTPPFHPYRRGLARGRDLRRRPKPLRRFVFCCTGRLPAFRLESRTLSGTLPCGVRTFLPRACAPGSDHPAACTGYQCTRCNPQPLSQAKTYTHHRCHPERRAYSPPQLSSRAKSRYPCICFCL